MNRRITEIFVSTTVLFVSCYLLWPPNNVYWVSIGEQIGDSLTIALVLLVAGGVGVGIAIASQISLSNLGIGGGLAYVLGMFLINRTMSPNSPVHLYLYGVLLLCILLGAAAVEFAYRTDNGLLERIH
ncbi:hypothetical protein [Halostella pelagica]|uniref:hypothetical protein n=1 Tax=Halostella pelagica TaxID=2583824 RepID=UPI001081EB11|nr:hypothetical protein [Halostella pelagica]